MKNVLLVKIFSTTAQGCIFLQEVQLFSNWQLYTIDILPPNQNCSLTTQTPLMHAFYCSFKLQILKILNKTITTFFYKYEGMWNSWTFWHESGRILCIITQNVIWKNTYNLPHSSFSQCFHNSVVHFKACGKMYFYISTMFPKFCSKLMSNMEERMNIEEYMWNVEELK